MNFLAALYLFIFGLLSMTIPALNKLSYAGRIAFTTIGIFFIIMAIEALFFNMLGVNYEN